MILAVGLGLPFRLAISLENVRHIASRFVSAIFVADPRGPFLLIPPALLVAEKAAVRSHRRANSAVFSSFPLVNNSAGQTITRPTPIATLSLVAF